MRELIQLHWLTRMDILGSESVGPCYRRINTFFCVAVDERSWFACNAIYCESIDCAAARRLEMTADYNVMRIATINDQ